MRRCFCCSMGFLRSVSLDAAPFHPLPEPRCSLFLRGPEGTRIARPITPARWIEAPKGSRIGRAINSLGSLQTQRVSNSSNPDGLGVVLRTNGARKGRAMIRYFVGMVVASGRNGTKSVQPKGATAQLQFSFTHIFQLRTIGPCFLP